MKHTAINTTASPPTLMPMPADPAHAPPGTKYKYVPRVRCADCPGKIYVPLGFESHLKNKKHRENVEARMAKEKEKEGRGKEL